MAHDDKSSDTVRLEELLISSLSMCDALAKLLIEKKLITEAEFTAMVSAERVAYQGLLGGRRDS